MALWWVLACACMVHDGVGVVLGCLHTCLTEVMPKWHLGRPCPPPPSLHISPLSHSAAAYTLHGGRGGVLGRLLG
jgi:hypothetical protein